MTNFCDSSTKSRKAVLLNNGNIYPSISLAYSIQMKKDYENVKQLLFKIRYAKSNLVCLWQLDIVFFVGSARQGGYTKITAFFTYGIAKLIESTAKRIGVRQGKK